MKIRIAILLLLGSLIIGIIGIPIQGYAKSVDLGQKIALDVSTSNIVGALNNAESTTSNLVLVEGIIIGLLLIATIVGIVTRRIRVPYTVGLVLIGLALSIVEITEIEVSPELILGLLVPPLIFEAAFHIPVKELRQNIAPILAFAVPGVLITTFLVGAVVSFGTGFPPATAFIFGALIAATDPVAVVALFRTLGVPKRLQVLLEGESLFNDGTAIVMFKIMVTIAITGLFSIVDSIESFFVIAGGGLIVGLILGFIISQLINQIDESMIETTLTTILAFGSYLVAEQLHVSGVLAVVGAGLVAGNIGPRGMSPTTRIQLFNFWEYAAFIANSIVFLLIGLQIDLNIMIDNWQTIIWAILAVLAARAVSVYGLSWVGRGLPTRYKHVIFWGGMRGAISLALAFSLPSELGSAREQIQSMAFGVVLFTLLVQGLSMGPLIKKMKLLQRSAAKDDFEIRNARASLSRIAYDHLEKSYNSGMISAHSWKTISKLFREQSKLLAEAVGKAIHADPELEVEEMESAWKDALSAQRGALYALQRDGIINEHTFTQIMGEVDLALTEREVDWRTLIQRDHMPSINRLLAVVVEELDAEGLHHLLHNQGYPTIQMPSTGGLSGRGNVTLLIGSPKGKEHSLIKLLKDQTKDRVSFDFSESDIQNPILATSYPMTIGGATVFILDVERYEEI